MRLAHKAQVETVGLGSLRRTRQQVLAAVIGLWKLPDSADECGRAAAKHFRQVAGAATRKKLLVIRRRWVTYI
jgi:hypothetical protein